MTDFLWRVVRLVDEFRARVRVFRARVRVFRARVSVLATAAVTWLTIAGVVIQSVIAETGSDWPWIADYGTRALVVIGVIHQIIRRVTPVAKQDRGILS